MLKEKILILRTEQLGDFIVTIPVFNEIKKYYPYTELTIMLKKINYDLAKNLDIFDKIIIYEDPFTQRNVSIFKIIKNPKGIVNTIKHFLWLRDNKYDLAIDFSGRKYNKIRFKLIKAKKKILANPKDIRKLDERERVFKVVRELGLSYPKHPKFLNLDKDAEKKVDFIMKKYKLEDKKIVSVHPLTPLKEKNWPLEKFKELFTILDKKNIVFLLLGTKEEYRETNQYIKNCENIINLMSKLSLFETYEIIKRSDIFLGLDSGPLHMAKYTDTPLIAIFGNENLEYIRWGPKRKIDKGFEKNNLNELEASNIAKEIIKKIKEK